MLWANFLPCRRAFCFRMSIKIMSKVWEYECKSHTEKLVFLALADNANDQSVCWPSIKTIARKCGMSENGVRLQIEELIRRNLLTKKTGGGHLANRYKIADFGDPSTACTPSLGAGQPSTACRSGVHGVETNRNETSSTINRERDFEIFWEAYPRKASKGIALCEWSLLASRGLLPEIGVIVKAIVSKSKSDDWNRGTRWIQKPSTWLRGLCWNDDDAHPSKTPAKRTVAPALDYIEVDGRKWPFSGQGPLEAEFPGRQSMFLTVRASWESGKRKAGLTKP